MLSTFNNDYDKRILDIVQRFPTKYSKILASANPKVREKYGDVQELLEYILVSTPKLDSPQYSLKTRIYWTLNHLIDFPACQWDGKPLVGRNVKTIFKGYKGRYCSDRCKNLAGARNHRLGKSTQAQKSRIVPIVHDCCQHFHTEQRVAKIREVKRKKAYERLKADSDYEPLFTFEEFLGFSQQRQHLFSWRHRRCGTIFMSKYTGRHDICPICSLKYRRTSDQEEAMYQYVVKSLNAHYGNELKSYHHDSENRKVLENNYELDIWIPELLLAFEYNGMLWHSIDNGHGDGYHLKKTVQCEKKGIRLVHIWEDEWLHFPERTKSLIDQAIASDYQFSDDVIKLRRDVYSKAVKVTGYVLAETISPEIHVSIHGHRYEDCGHLIYQKAFPKV